MSSQTNYGYDNAQLTGSEHAPRSTTTERSIVVDAESVLWSSGAQRGRDRLEWLLHDDFTGVTREGERVDREDLMGTLHRAVPRGEREFAQWAFHDLPWPLVLTTYRLADDRGTSLHMSIWDISTGLARLRFHQGTWESVGHEAPEVIMLAGTVPSTRSLA